ncbi:MAG: GIY-YIG nuclease family protein [Planctomycetes bacterium]|nr:GIY-YIG nuclease family protein [Planctomycetota bacterium]
MNVSSHQYERFGAWLRANTLGRVTLSFAEIEQITGAKLPASALSYSAWWSNSVSHPLARVWLEAGWEVPSEGLQWTRKEITLVRRRSEEARSAGSSHAHQIDLADDVVHEPGARIAVSDDWHDLLPGARRVPIEPERDAAGNIRRFQPQNNYERRAETPLNRYGHGSFCRFRVPSDIKRAGVYLIVTDGRLAYVGECQDFSQRFNAGYGQISPKDCYKGGQETNCRINQLILRCAESGWQTGVHFIETPHRFALETALIQTHHPPWNR